MPVNPSRRLFRASGRQVSIATRTILSLPRHISDALGARLADRENSLSPHAVRASASRGREVPEPPSPMRSEFQRDRDRIIHTKAFRRLKHKTQVFIAPLGDHYVTRLTHTLEVAQIARTIARALNLNEDLTEAIALGHDLGHTPFGHVGEDEMALLHHDGFRHNRQSLRIVETLEKDGQGLNLMWEVRQGILRHSKPQGDFLDATLVEDLSLEGQICRVSDAVAYLNHDLADAFRAGVLEQDQLPESISDVLGVSHARRIDSLVSDIIASSWAASGDSGAGSNGRPVISMSHEVRATFNELRDFMFKYVYIPVDEGDFGQAARQIVRSLYRHFNLHRDQIPPEYGFRSRSENMIVVDFISGMTDLYAIRVAENIQPGITKPFQERRST